MTAKLLSRDALVGREIKLETRIVEVPEWGGSVMVRQFTGKDSEAIRQYMEAEAPRPGFRQAPKRRSALLAQMALRGCVREDGRTPFFSQDDLPWLEAQPVRALNRIGQALIELNGEDVSGEEMEGNSEAISGDDSSTA